MAKVNHACKADLPLKFLNTCDFPLPILPFMYLEDDDVTGCSFVINVCVR